MFLEKALSLTTSPHSFTPFATITHREAWESLSPDISAQLIECANASLNYNYPPISATLFMDFVRTGNRVRFEDVFMDRRHKLNHFIIAECIENKARFLDDIINGIWCICEESAWQLPAHNNYINDPTQRLLPDTTRPLLDLFSCETGAILGMSYYLLKEKLDEVSKLVCQRIEHEVHNRIIEPYLNDHFWWMGRPGAPMNNWTIWCTQNVLLAAFLTPQSDEIRQQIIKKAATSIDFFLASYGEDGCCDEGAQYYRHAGLCLFNALEILNAVTDNAFDLYTDPKIKNIAEYILNVHIDDAYYINFADCSPIAGRAGAREFLFGKRIGSDNLCRFASLDYKKTPDKLNVLENNLFYRVQSLFTHDQLLHYCTDQPVQYKDTYYESVGLFSARDNNLFLAVKAGHNGDSHNHNDTGSFTVYKNGQPMIIDIGVETYTQKTFSKDRYDIWAMQSQYHNLPTIHGVMQQDGKTYAAKDVSVTLQEDISTISMDIAQAYPKEAGIISYRREASLIKGSCITVTDAFELTSSSANDLKHPVTLSLMFYERPTIEGTTLLVGDLGKVVLEGAVSLSLKELPITDPRLQITWKHNIYRVLATVNSTSIRLTIS